MSAPDPLVTAVIDARLAAVTARRHARLAFSAARDSASDEVWEEVEIAQEAARRAYTEAKLAKYYAKRDNAYQVDIAVCVAMAAAETAEIALRHITKETEG